MNFMKFLKFSNTQ